MQRRRERGKKDREIRSDPIVKDIFSYALKLGLHRELSKGLQQLGAFFADSRR